MLSSNKHLIIGLDGFDWSIAQPMIAAKLLPNLEKLIKQGNHGPLQMVLPKSLSTTWATTLSGLWPDQHNILTEHEPGVSGEGNIAVNHLSTCQSMLWHWLAPAHLKTQLLGCYLTEPAIDSVDVCIGQHFPGHAQFGGQWQDIAAENIAGLKADDLDYLALLRLAPADLPIEALEPLINDIKSINQDGDRRPAIIAEALARTISLHNAATWLMETRPVDVMLVNYPLLSHVVGHFTAYQPPQHVGINSQDFQRYNAVIQGLYLFFDSLLGRLMQLMGANARIMLLSHYAFDRHDSQRARGYGLKQSHSVEKTTTGHVIFSGAGLNNNTQIMTPHQIDIVPTLLASSGVAIPSTLAGRIWDEVFTQPIVSRQQQTVLNETKSWPEIGSGLSQQDFLWLAELSAQGMVDPLAQKIKLQRAALDRARILNKQLAQVSKGDIRGASVTLISWLKEYPHDIDVKLELVNLLFFNNQHQALLPFAKEALLQLKAMDEQKISLPASALSTVTRIKLLQAAIAFTEQKEEDALRQLRQIDFASIQDATMQSFAGHCFLKLKAFKEAEVIFQRAISINAGFGPAYTGLSCCLYEQQKYVLAADIGLKAVELQAGDFASHRILGLTFENLQELDIAELHYRVFLQRYPNDSDIRSRLQTIQEKKG